MCNMLNSKTVVIVLLLVMLPFTKRCIVIGKQVIVILKKIPRLSTQKMVFIITILFSGIYIALYINPFDKSIALFPF